MQRNLIAITLFFLMLISSLPAHAQDKVTSTGMAAVHRGIIDIARDKAIDNALRNAVEEQVGIMITSFSEVENFQLKMDQILTESKGFINSYRIISEGREGDAYKVTIEATVGTGRLKDRMAAIDLIMVRKMKPRLMVVFAEPNPQNVVAETAMTRYFLSQGFRVIDAGASRKTGRAMSPPLPGSDVRRVATLAQSYGAEVVILGKLDLARKTFKMGDIEITATEVTLSGRVINGDTAEIITTDSKSRRGEVRAVTEELARELARSLKEETLDRWSGELTNVAVVKLLLSGLHTYRDLLYLKDQLSNEVKGFRQLHQRSYAAGEVDLDIEMRGNAQGLADDLAAITVLGRKIAIVEISPNAVAARLLP